MLLATGTHLCYKYKYTDQSTIYTPDSIQGVHYLRLLHLKIMKLSLAVYLIIGISVVEFTHGVVEKFCPPKENHKCIDIIDHCKEDSDCGRDRICCPRRCGKECWLPEKPGKCPVATKIGFCHHNLCSHDFECKGRQKCCSSFCGRICMNPIYLEG
uniref:WAP four-disulfide core domain protein 5-like n=1 Tax=Myxine glutinosa TaxID=7769 RepID=UPI00358ECAA3